MTTISLDKSDELELGEIPNTSQVSAVVQVKKNKPANCPLARLFFDPSKLNASPLQNQSETANDLTPPQSEPVRNESSHSEDSYQSKRGSQRSRSRQKKKSNHISDEQQDKKKKRKRFGRNKKLQNGNFVTFENNNMYSVGEQKSNKPFQSQNNQRLQSQVLQQKSPIRQNKTITLDVKQSYETLFTQRMPEKSGYVKLNNTNFDRFFKTRICPQFKAGHCERNQRCTYAHGQKQLRDVHNSKSSTYKTRTCTNFEKGLCHKKKQECSYAHGKEDLRSFKHEEHNAKSEPRVFKNQDNNLGRGTINQKNERTRAEQRQSQSSSNDNFRQTKNDHDQNRRTQNNKTNQKSDKDINSMYALNERQRHYSIEKMPANQNFHHFDHNQEVNYNNNNSDQVAHKNLYGNNYFGGQFPPGMPFLQSQSQMQGYPPFGESYPNYYFPFYPVYPPMPGQHQMNFYPSFANFPAQTSNNAALNAPKSNFQYFNGYNYNGPFDGNLNGASRGDKKQGNRNRASKNQQQPSNNH